MWAVARDIYRGAQRSKRAKISWKRAEVKDGGRCVCLAEAVWGSVCVWDSGRKINRENEGEEEAGSSFLKLPEQSINQQPPEPPGEWQRVQVQTSEESRAKGSGGIFPGLTSYFKDLLVMLVAWLQGWQCQAVHYSAPKWNIFTTTAWTVKTFCADAHGSQRMNSTDCADDICSRIKYFHND